MLLTLLGEPMCCLVLQVIILSLMDLCIFLLNIVCSITSFS
jgi:hypothetical protein